MLRREQVASGEMGEISSGTERGMITIPCLQCHAPIPLTEEQPSQVSCPKCGTVRLLHWFQEPNAFEKWRSWMIKTGRIRIHQRDLSTSSGSIEGAAVTQPRRGAA